MEQENDQSEIKQVTLLLKEAKQQIDGLKQQIGQLYDHKPMRLELKPEAAPPGSNQWTKAVNKNTLENQIHQIKSETVIATMSIISKSSDEVKLQSFEKMTNWKTDVDKPWTPEKTPDPFRNQERMMQDMEEFRKQDEKQRQQEAEKDNKSDKDNKKDKGQDQDKDVKDNVEAKNGKEKEQQEKGKEENGPGQGQSRFIQSLEDMEKEGDDMTSKKDDKEKDKADKTFEKQNQSRFIDSLEKEDTQQDTKTGNSRFIEALENADSYGQNGFEKSGGEEVANDNTPSHAPSSGNDDVDI